MQFSNRRPRRLEVELRRERVNRERITEVVGALGRYPHTEGSFEYATPERTRIMRVLVAARLRAGVVLLGIRPRRSCRASLRQASAGDPPHPSRASWSPRFRNAKGVSMIDHLSVVVSDYDVTLPSGAMQSGTTDAAGKLTLEIPETEPAQQ